MTFASEMNRYGLDAYAALGPHEMKRDIYDALELSAEATGGLLPWRVITRDAKGNAIPACLNGHAAFLDGVGPIDAMAYHQSTTALEELRRLDIDFTGLPDYAIELTSGSKSTRAPFADVMKRLNIVRGDT